MGYAFGVAIPITNDNPDGGDKDGRNGVCSAAKSGGDRAAKTTPLIKTLTLRALQYLLAPAAPV